MKKKLFYTVTFLLCGAFFFSSCEDMLNVESDRVEYEFTDWTYNDSVYSVLGILKSVQKVGDRQVLLGELRGDLLSGTDKISDDLRDIMNFDFNADTNPFLAAKDYYSIINNCNIFLSRVDTSLVYNGRKLMMREYVAVKSVRAWTYLQLLKNHEYIPYFTDPVLTHSKAEEVMSGSVADQITVASKLIDDIAPYENYDLSKVDELPFWNIPDILAAGKTHKLFMPIRVLLGDLYLWRASLKAETSSYPLATPNYDSDFAKAAKCYTTYLSENNRYSDNSNRATHAVLKPDESGEPGYKSYASRFVIDDKNPNEGMIAVIRFAADEKTGVVSELADYFAPVGDNRKGYNQLKASPAIAALSARQTYLYQDFLTGSSTKFDSVIIESEKFPGDLRFFSTTATQIGSDINETKHNGIIVKHNLENTDRAIQRLGNDNYLTYTSGKETQTIVLDRPENIYLRFAEALMGLEREGWDGAKELAMKVLKSGVKERYSIYWDSYYDTIPAVDEHDNIIEIDLKDVNGVTVKKTVIDENTGNPMLDADGRIVYEIQKAPKMIVEIKSKGDFEPLVFDFSDNVFSGNMGIHSRGSGFTEANYYYNLSDSCVAMYYGIPDNGTTSLFRRVLRDEREGNLKQVAKTDATGAIEYDPVTGKALWEYVYAPDVVVKDYTISEEDRVKYMYDKIIDEMALEMCWEGHRFGDLSRMAISLGNNDFFAMRVAARNSEDAPNWWTQGSNFDGALYGKLQNRSNWYMPLPDGFDPGVAKKE